MNSHVSSKINAPPCSSIYRLNLSMDSSVNVPRWTPNPARSPQKEPEPAHDALEVQSIVSEEDNYSFSNNMETNFPFSTGFTRSTNPPSDSGLNLSMDSAVKVPRWTPSPARSPQKEPELAHDALMVRSIVSEEDNYSFSNNMEINFPFSTGFTRSTNPPPDSGLNLSMDSSVNVPRWTPNPARSPRKEPEPVHDALEVQSIVSEQDNYSFSNNMETNFPFSTGLTRSTNPHPDSGLNLSMDSAVKVPRWIPSPARSPQKEPELAHDASKVRSLVSEEDNYSFSNNMETNFPFSTGFTRSTNPPPGSGLNLSMDSSVKVPRWTPNPARSPQKEPEPAHDALEVQSIVSEEDNYGFSNNMETNFPFSTGLTRSTSPPPDSGLNLSMDSSVNVPRWTPKPARSPQKEPEPAHDALEVQSIVSKEDNYSFSNNMETNFPFSTGLTRSTNPPPDSGLNLSMDSAVKVTRWIPRSARSPQKGPELAHDALKVRSIVSEEDNYSFSNNMETNFPFSTGFTRSTNPPPDSGLNLSMDSSVNIRRWTPSPARSLPKEPEPAHDALKVRSIVSEEDNYSFSNNMETNFPFSTGFARSTNSHPDSDIDHEEPSFRIEMDPVGSRVDCTPKADGIFLTWTDSGGKKQTRAILQGLTGYAEPGEVLAITGPSGSGKSTLLDALAGLNLSMDSSVNVPRWTPNPARSPQKEPERAHDALEVQSIVSEQDNYSFSNNMETNFPFSTGFTRSTNPPSDSGLNLSMDSAVKVPRWIPSPARSPRKEPELAHDALKVRSIVSEEDNYSFSNNMETNFPFSTGFTRSTNPPPDSGLNLRTDSSANVPRWTPSPARSPQKEPEPAHDALKVRSIVSEEDNYSFSNNMETNFPFSIGFLRRTNPHPDSDIDHEGPSFRIEMEPVGSRVDCKPKADGIFLTWTDLWVTVSSGNKQTKAILQGLTGYAEPGEVLAILGPSGSGKSTLLDALAGRIGSNTRQTGEILINGHKETLAFGTSAYVTQDDTLMTTLTVREAVYYSAQLQLPDSMSRSEKKERAEMTIREMGLQDSTDTRIGGWSTKGLSGGQKRRVSICIEILTRPKLLFLDEPTSGLDSAASYHVMSRIVKLACRDRRTVIASIHQPSSEVFQLFHNLCLLSSGKTVYFGAVSMAEQFFATNGFPCPSLRNPSDHYLRTINKDFDEDIELGQGSINTEKVIDTLVQSYKSSGICNQVKEHVFKISQQKGGLLEKKGSQASFITQSIVLTKRSFVNMYRDLGYYWLRLAIYIALCLCVGTIFFDIGFSFGSIQARGSMLMFVAAFLTFMAIGGFPSFVEDMKIFGRERLNGHYGVGAFVIGNTFSSIPYLFMISLIPGVLAYYLVGLQKSFEHFAYFVILLFACTMLVESLMMTVASIVPDFLMGIITGAGIQGVMMLNGGFFRLPDDLPKPFWRYPMYYIAFHKYANQGFYKNEFEGLTFPNNQAGGPATITGDEILRNFWQVEMGYSKWIDMAILFGMVIIYRLMFWGIIKTVEKAKPLIKAYKAVPPRLSSQISETPFPTNSQ
ncbi:uncharacterized protein LOC111291677 isoform X3 [Durio zibethinus]|uniref:Uncharacterized protein LOC111291677 isoform X3 n=1 Tax=Durio zibethinus TaxID=66656 RepID=A0A6P5YFS8_DURZI|nr:uncharacterized protein LOC111291677 isoform X3 [Durio zibethinus]